MALDMVADMELDMAADMFKTKCIKPVMFQNEEYWAEAVWCEVYLTCVSSKLCKFILLRKALKSCYQNCPLETFREILIAISPEHMESRVKAASVMMQNTTQVPVSAMSRCRHHKCYQTDIDPLSTLVTLVNFYSKACSIFFFKSRFLLLLQ